jgi:hypothetical protein
MATGYDYMVEIDNIFPVTDGVVLKALVGITGPTYRTTNYKALKTHIFNGGSSQANYLTTYISMSGTSATLGNVAGETSRYSLTLFDPANSSVYTWFKGDMYTDVSDTTYTNGLVGGEHHVTEAITALQFAMSSGNISTGTFKLYKRANA